MKTLKNTALLALSLVFLAVSAADVDAGGKKGGKRRGGHRGHHHHRRVIVKRYYPPKPAPPVKVVPAGAAITIPGYYGRHPGHVLVLLGHAKLHAKVVKWTPHGVTVIVPRIKLTKPVLTKLIVTGWNKYAYKPFPVKIVPGVPPKPAPPILVQTPGAAPAPAAPSAASAPAGFPPIQVQ